MRPVLVTAQKGFVDAYTAGRRWAVQAHLAGTYKGAEDIISGVMQNNPYKGERARKDFIEGVSSWVNTQTSMVNRATASEAL